MKNLTLNMLILLTFFVPNLSCAGNTDIEFKGKKTLNYKEICSGKGEKYTDEKFGFSINKGQYVCKPNFKTYAGENLISERNDGCDSAIEYDSVSGRVVDMYLRYPIDSSEKLLEVLTEKYGETKNQRQDIDVDKSLNFEYSWVGKSNISSGFIRLSKETVFKTINGNHQVVRRCTTLRIMTSTMMDDSISMRERYDGDKKRILKTEASKL
jgi:hypothetical protein